jgi:threonine synthase
MRETSSNLQIFKIKKNKKKNYFAWNSSNLYRFEKQLLYMRQIVIDRNFKIINI